MSDFGKRVRQLRKGKGHTLRSLAPLVGVDFTYLCKVESGKLDFGDAPSVDLIIRLADVLKADADKLMLMAGRIPESIASRIRECPREFMLLASCDARELKRISSELRQGG